jgi:hypothetical protein
MKPTKLEERGMANLEKERTGIDDPGYPRATVPERRDLLDWIGWTLAAVGLLVLIVAVAVVIGM